MVSLLREIVPFLESLREASLILRALGSSWQKGEKGESGFVIFFFFVLQSFLSRVSPLNYHRVITNG